VDAAAGAAAATALVAATVFVSCARSDETLNAAVAIKATVKRIRFMVMVCMRFKLLGC
jgi:hypothetical protein